MAIFTKRQKQIATQISEEAELSNWKWQLKHSIKDIYTFKLLTGINFELEERKKLEKTVEKFPLNPTSPF